MLPYRERRCCHIWVPACSADSEMLPRPLMASARPASMSILSSFLIEASRALLHCTLSSSSFSVLSFSVLPTCFSLLS